jgi:hypothetical protein
MLPKIAIGFSLITIFHACYSTLDHFQYSQKSQKSSPLPLDIVIELMVGLLICIVGTISDGTLLDIHSGEEVKPVLLSRVASHRGQYLFRK